MKKIALSSQWSMMEAPFRDIHGPSIAIPSQYLDRLGQVHYFLDLKNSKGCRVDIDLSNHVMGLQSGQNTKAGYFPLNIPNWNLWQKFCIGPHSDILLRQQCFLVGQRAFNRFIELDLKKKTASLLDLEVEDDFLSCTNWINPVTGDVWFASWSLQDSIQRISDPRALVRVRIWQFSASSQHIYKVWDGHAGDFLHQLNISEDGRYLVLCEMGMRPAIDVPPGHPGQYPNQWKIFLEQGIIPSEILVLDLEKGSEWKLSIPAATPAHVEFDSRNPHKFYVSCHNIGLVEGANVLFGPGTIYCFELHSDGPHEKRFFTAQDFYRITTHHVFNHQGRTLIGVTGFPDTVFLLDAETMKLNKKIRLFNGEKISTEFQPHFCKQDHRSPYSLSVSEDGNTLYVVGSGVFFVIDVETGLLKESPWMFYQERDNETITGHLTSY